MIWCVIGHSNSFGAEVDFMRKLVRLAIVCSKCSGGLVLYKKYKFKVEKWKSIKSIHNKRESEKCRQ